MNAFDGVEQKKKSAVDYVLEALVYDNLRTTMEIVANEIEDESTKSSLVAQLVAVEEYLKFISLEHISKYTDPIHNQAHAMSKRNINGVKPKSTGCLTCLKHSQVIHVVQSSRLETNAKTYLTA